MFSLFEFIRRRYAAAVAGCCCAPALQRLLLESYALVHTPLYLAWLGHVVFTFDVKEASKLNTFSLQKHIS